MFMRKPIAAIPTMIGTCNMDMYICFFLLLCTRVKKDRTQQTQSLDKKTAPETIQDVPNIDFKYVL